MGFQIIPLLKAQRGRFGTTELLSFVFASPLLSSQPQNNCPNKKKYAEIHIRLLCFWKWRLKKSKTPRELGDRQGCWAKLKMQELQRALGNIPELPKLSFASKTSNAALAHTARCTNNDELTMKTS